MPDEVMTDMAAAPSLGDQLDADDLITYDETEEIEWAKDASSHTTPAAKPTANLTGGDAAGVSAASDIQLLGVDSVDVDLGVISAPDSNIAAFESNPAGGLDDIDWDDQEAFTGDGLGMDATLGGEASLEGVESGDIQLAHDEVLYDEDIDGTDTYASQQPVTHSHVPGGSGADDLDDVIYDEDADEGDDAENAEDDDEDEDVAEDEQQDDGEVDDEVEDGESEENSASAEYEDESEEGAEVAKEVAIVPDDEDDEDDDADDSEPTQIPAITISYRSEEYPLFKGTPGADKMPFFRTVAPYEYTMDRLLASFRQELSAELGPDDEIVLQIDELGLEFSESTKGDSLSGASLRQLAEIYDQLVKNQDPDSSRSLYAYLLIRPNTAKRLESLIEDAFAGKGLDEVVFYFPRPDSGHHGVGDHAAGAVAVEEDKFLEDYESNDSDEDTGANAASAEDEHDYGDNHDADEDDEASYDNQSESREDEAATHEEDEHGDDELAGEEDQAAALNDQANDGNVAFDFLHEETEQTTTYNDFDDADQADPLFQPEAEAFDDLVQADDGTGPDLDAGLDGAGADEASKVTSSTSGTATLTGEDEIDFETDVDGQHSVPQGTGTADENEWGSAVDLATDNTTTGKRSREEDDDELGEGDENDVKRRRS